MDMDEQGTATLPVERKRYVLKYKDEYDQVAVLEGILVHLDLKGFVVMDIEGVTTLTPKDRIYSLREVCTGWLTSPPLKGSAISSP